MYYLIQRMVNRHLIHKYTLYDIFRNKRDKIGINKIYKDRDRVYTWDRARDRYKSEKGRKERG